MSEEVKITIFHSVVWQIKSENFSSKDWWPILKSFISPSNSSIPTLEKDGFIFTDETDKANVLNDFFRDQTILDDQHAPIQKKSNKKLTLITLCPH